MSKKHRKHRYNKNLVNQQTNTCNSENDYKTKYLNSLVEIRYIKQKIDTVQYMAYCLYGDVKRYTDESFRPIELVIKHISDFLKGHSLELEKFDKLLQET